MNDEADVLTFEPSRLVAPHSSVKKLLYRAVRGSQPKLMPGGLHHRSKKDEIGIGDFFCLLLNL
jgi:hypothetical protein